MSKDQSHPPRKIHYNLSFSVLQLSLLRLGVCLKSFCWWAMRQSWLPGLLKASGSMVCQLRPPSKWVWVSVQLAGLYFFNSWHQLIQLGETRSSHHHSSSRPYGMRFHLKICRTCFQKALAIHPLALANYWKLLTTAPVPCVHRQLSQALMRKRWIKCMDFILLKNVKSSF